MLTTKRAEKEDKTMTKKEMMGIIKENNINKDIRWAVDSTKNNGIIVITNDYSDEVRFTITKIAYDEEIEGITIKDDFTESTVGMLLKGDDRWSDFREWDEGIGSAVKATVKSFYNRY